MTLNYEIKLGCDQRGRFSFDLGISLFSINTTLAIRWYLFGGERFREIGVVREFGAFGKIGILKYN